MVIFLIFTIIFLGTFIFNVIRGATHDRRAEWLYFCILHDEKKLNGHGGNNMESCLLSVALPYYLGKLIHVKPSYLFALIPALFHALIPTFAYLITVHFTNSIWAGLVAVLFVVSNYFFLRDPNLGRISIGNGLIAGLVWAVVTGNLAWSLVFACILPIAYYSASYYSMFLLAPTILLYPLAIYPYAILLTTLFIWQQLGVKTAQVYCQLAVDGIIKNDITKVESIKTGTPVLKTTEAWEGVVWTAFGRGLGKMPLLKQLEWLTSWAVIGLIGFSLLNYSLPTKYLVFILIPSVAIVMCLFNKVLARYYGIPRTYFTALPLLAPMVATIPWAVILLAFHFCVVLMNSIIYPIPKYVEDNWQRQTAPSWKEVMEKVE